MAFKELKGGDIIYLVYSQCVSQQPKLNQYFLGYGTVLSNSISQYSTPNQDQEGMTQVVNCHHLKLHVPILGCDCSRIYTDNDNKYNTLVLCTDTKEGITLILNLFTSKSEAETYLENSCTFRIKLLTQKKEDIEKQIDLYQQSINSQKNSMKKVDLFNRDGATLKLVSEDGKVWVFDVDEKHNYVLEYMRVGYGDDMKTIAFVDPSGGPFISVGDGLTGGLVVKSIVWNKGFQLITG